MVQISVRTRAGIRVRRRDPRLSAIKTPRPCALHREMAGDELVPAEFAHNRLLKQHSEAERANIACESGSPRRESR